MKALKPKHKTENEFSRFLKMESMSPSGAQFTLSPTMEEAERIAQRLSLITLSQFTIEVKISLLVDGRKKRPHDGFYQVNGEFQAKLQQACVVTCEPIDQILHERFNAVFTDRMPSHHEDKEDTPENLEDGGIDLGELAVQQLSLALPAFPRLAKQDLDEFAKRLGASSVNLVLADDPDYDEKLKRLHHE